MTRSPLKNTSNPAKAEFFGRELVAEGSNRYVAEVTPPSSLDSKSGRPTVFITSDFVIPIFRTRATSLEVCNCGAENELNAFCLQLASHSNSSDMKGITVRFIEELPGDGDEFGLLFSVIELTQLRPLIELVEIYLGAWLIVNRALGSSISAKVNVRKGFASQLFVVRFQTRGPELQARFDPVISVSRFWILSLEGTRSVIRFCIARSPNMG